MYCEENVTIRTEVFIHVIVVMAYVFTLFRVVTVVCNGGSCFYLENDEQCK